MSRFTPGARRATRWVGLLFLSAYATACDSAPTAPADGESVIVEPSAANLSQGERLQLAVNVLSAGGDPISSSRVVYSSADPSIVSVTTRGVLIAQRAGTTYVEVRSDRGRTVVPVTISQLAVKLDMWTAARVTVGSAELLSVSVLDLHGFPMVSEVTVRSSDERVAAVRKSRADWPNAHEVVGVAEGDVSITATSGGVSVTTTVTVVR